MIWWTSKHVRPEVSFQSLCDLTFVTIHCTKIGIFLSNTPGSVNNATATTAVFLMISVFRGFSYAERSLRQLKWKPEDFGHMRDLEGKTLAILGLGGIGTRLAELAHAFHMRIIYFSRRRNPLAPRFCEYIKEVEEMIRQADALSIHVPLCPETTGLVGERWIRMLKPGAVIINTARGKVIDEEALMRALEDRHVRFSPLCFARTFKLFVSLVALAWMSFHLSLRSTHDY